MGNAGLSCRVDTLAAVSFRWEQPCTTVQGDWQLVTC